MPTKMKVTVLGLDVVSIMSIGEFFADAPTDEYVTHCPVCHVPHSCKPDITYAFAKQWLTMSCPKCKVSIDYVRYLSNSGGYTEFHQVLILPLPKKGR